MKILRPSEEALQEAAAAIQAGKLVIMPTETVYGLAADAGSTAAVEKIFAAKKRPKADPLIVHAASEEQAREAVSHWPEESSLLSNAFWPGPLSIILPKSDRLSPLVTGGLATTAVRWPDHPVAQALIRASGRLIAAPSANLFMRLSPSRAADIDPEIAKEAEMILDGGACRVGIESTVISLAGNQPRILRFGMISQVQIEEVIGPVLLGPSASDPQHSSPGLFARHYAPLAKTRLVDRAQGPDALLFESKSSGPGQIEMPRDPEAYARELYASLKHLEAQGAAEIEIEVPPKQPDWAAVWDRITKASASEDV